MQSQVNRRSARPRPSSAVTLQQVAQDAGVSLATASRVLSDSDRNVTQELQERVLEAAARLRYVSNAPARALVQSTTSIVGLVVHDVNDAYYSAIAAGVMEVARDHKLLVMLAGTFHEPGLQAEYVARLRAQRARAVVLAGSGFTGANPALAQELEAFAAQGGRVTAVAHQDLPVDTIMPGNREGGRAVAEHLAALGHTEIGIICGPLALVSVQERLHGFLERAAELGVVVQEHHRVEADFTREGGRAAAVRLFRRSPGITALFALNDAMALGALAALRDDLGRGVPSDVSVVGFDDLPVAGDVTPALTTVRLPLEEIGRRALLLALGDATASPRTLAVPSRLVVRASTAPPPRVTG
ncbi:LacI family DNA-binding transcriptional regulator [Streptomyces sp. NPDC059278]|uniref:LacI family DNA-binding transcriptional regulator n=1 Tax=Streptomyces sp. NPDC059278 TaxID=3346801 RepID=UPI0036D018A8